jgi:pimeloyl-ACP methyl ester carboxylesterase
MNKKSSWFRLRMLVILDMLGLLAACGGGSGTPNDTVPPGTPPPTPEVPAPPSPPTTPPITPVGAGELKSATELKTVTAAEIAAALAAGDGRAKGFTPVYSVKTYRLEYLTSDADGLPVRASGLVAVPVKAAGAKSPLLSYQHATTFRDAEVPSNNAVASEVSVVLASLGFIVAAPDYVGYGVSKGTAHPYLLGAPSGAAVVDFLTASDTWRRANGVIDNGQLFLTGYSEGGYVTMAAHRALQFGNSPHLQRLRLVVAGAGPYDVQATLDGLVDVVRDEVRVLGALIDPDLLRFLGSSLRRQLRDELIKRLLPGDADVVFDTRFLDYFLADDQRAVALQSSVHNWRPTLPVRLFHGRDDKSVPYASSVSALQTMQGLGAGSLVSLTDCTAVPSTHLGCVPDYLLYLLGQLAGVVQDL